MDRDDAIRKISKLLALADKDRGASDAEATQALLTAQKYMAQWDVEMAEIEGETPEESVSTQCDHPDNLGYRCQLATVIARNFKCKTYMLGTTVVFYGHKSDTQIAKASFEFAYRFIRRAGNRICEQVRKKGYSARGVFNSYAMGFILGANQALEEQCHALMIITPPDVEEDFEGMSQSWKQYGHGMREQSSYYGPAYRQGKADGNECFSRKKLQEQ